MTKAILFYRNSLLTKLFMLVMLLVGGVNSVWATPVAIVTGKTIETGYATATKKANNTNPITLPQGGTLTATAAFISNNDGYLEGTKWSWYIVYSTAKVAITKGQKIEISAKGLGSTSAQVFFRYSSTSLSDNSTYTIAGNFTSEINSSTEQTEFTTLTIDTNSESIETGEYYIQFLAKGVNINLIRIVDSNGPSEPKLPTVSNIGYDNATFAWTKGGSETQWQVYCSTSEGVPDNYSGDLINTNSMNLSELEPGETYFAYVRAYINSDAQSDWVGTSFTTNPAPTEFTLNSYTGSTATFSWINGTGSNPSAWQIQYSTNEDFASDNNIQDGITSNPYTLSTGLTEGTKYYARIRADYGSSHYSDWSNKVEFVPSNDITINDGTTTNSYIPFCGYRANYDTKGQFIILKNKIENIENRQINKLTFYASADTKNWGNARFDVYVKETTTNSYSSSALENVYGINVLSAAELEVVDGKMEVNFAVPFNYTSDHNLLVTFKLKTQGISNATYWYGISASNMSCYVYNNGTSNYSGRESFSPKMSITYSPVTTAPVKIGATGFTSFSSPWALDLSSLPSGLKAYYITESGATEEAGKVKLTQLTEAVAANTGLLIKGTAGNVYEIPTTTSGTDLSSTNLLTAVGPLESLLSISSDKYVLVNNGGKAEFQNLAENSATIPGGKSYLDLTGITLPSSARLSISFDDGDTPTGIRIQENNVSAPDNTLYNLYGQKVEKTGRGIYIINGKKVILK